jgi:hypothetical protein
VEGTEEMTDMLTIQCQLGPREVEVLADYEHLAITPVRCDDVRFPFTITHKKTGLSVCQCNTMDTAHEIVAELSPLSCWQHDNPQDILAAGIGVSKILRRYHRKGRIDSPRKIKAPQDSPCTPGGNG